MNNPGPRLRALIAMATPEQFAKAREKVKAHRAACDFFGVETAAEERLMIEAIEIELMPAEGEEDIKGRRLELYNARDYRGTY